MQRGEISEKEKSAWLTSAMLIPAASAAAKASWTSVIAAVIISAVVSWCALPTMRKKWLSALRIGTIILLTAAYLPQTADCWRGRYAELVIPGVLLSVAAFSIIQGAAVAARSSNILRYGMAAFAVSILIVGIREIDIKNLHTSWELPDCGLLTVMLLPSLSTSKDKGKAIGKTGAIALASTIIVGGVMGSRADLYEFSKSISILGVTERLESLMAVAMTVGYYALLAYILGVGKKEWQVVMPGKESAGVILICVAAFLLQLNRMQTYSGVIPALIIVLWVIFPLLERMKKKMKKMKNNA